MQFCRPLDPSLQGGIRRKINLVALTFTSSVTQKKGSDVQSHMQFISLIAISITEIKWDRVSPPLHKIK